MKKKESPSSTEMVKGSNVGWMLLLIPLIIVGALIVGGLLLPSNQSLFSLIKTSLLSIGWPVWLIISIIIIIILLIWTNVLSWETSKKVVGKIRLNWKSFWNAIGAIAVMIGIVLFVLWLRSFFPLGNTAPLSTVSVTTQPDPLCQYPQVEIGKTYLLEPGKPFRFYRTPTTDVQVIIEEGNDGILTVQRWNHSDGWKMKSVDGKTTWIENTDQGYPGNYLIESSKKMRVRFEGNF